MERRLIDLLPTIRDHVYHPVFDGSFSLKQVLPALVPELRYEGMDIAEGRSASKELVIREGLLAYCKQDTWATVCLLRKLRELALGG